MEEAEWYLDASASPAGEIERSQRGQVLAGEDELLPEDLLRWGELDQAQVHVLELVQSKTPGEEREAF